MSGMLLSRWAGLLKVQSPETETLSRLMSTDLILSE